jgi:two-component system LytT family sensor kinase
MPVMTQEELLIINLLLRIAVMAGIASLVLGFRFVSDFLVRSTASAADRIRLATVLAAVFIVGIAVRKLTNQGAMDLSLEGALFAGFLGGIWVGGAVGVAIGAVCYLFGEPAGLPMYAGAGLASGFLVAVLGRGGEIWSYSLNPFSIVYSFIEGLWRRRLDRNIIPFAMLLAFAAGRYHLLERTRGRALIYGFLPPNEFTLVLEMVTIIYTLGIALKLANGARLELLLREEERQLLRARLVTLRSQINPHFLFNTLNSISTLIRTDADKAREMTRQLASIFRKALDDSNDTHSLRDELAFIDDYLAIERVRFGDERLRVVTDVDPAAFEAPVPVMILQPLVENAIKHGISGRIEGGVVRITARPLERGGVSVEIENDGAPVVECELDALFGRGLGLRNVTERLALYTCGAGRFTIEPRRNGGAAVRLTIPPPIARSVDSCRFER